MLDFKDIAATGALNRAEFGIERESLRVTAEGELAQTPHPFGASRNIDRDFCENQIEVISDVFDDPDALIGHLCGLLDGIYTELEKQNELLWPFSNPPHFKGEDDIPVANFTGELKSKSVYREYLAKKYGKQKMLFSGIHLNFSFTDTALGLLFERSEESCFRRFKDSLYLSLAKKLTVYSPLIVYLTAASPLTDPSLGICSNEYASVRCGEHGYWNSFVPILDYTDLESYIQSIERYVESGRLKSVSELYYPVRIKPRGANSLDGLRDKGVNHIELRVLDVNPLTRSGVFREDIRFIHLLMLWFLSLPDFDFDASGQTRTIESVKSAALYLNDDIRAQTENALTHMRRFADEYFPDFSDAVTWQQKKLISGGRYAEIISEMFGDDYLAGGIALARRYAGRDLYV